MFTLEMSEAMQYALFFFGVTITYIGWSTKKILENIEEAIRNTSEKVDIHEQNINKIITNLQVHEFKINDMKVQIDDIKKTIKP
jgi:hypothetical protein